MKYPLGASAQADATERVLRRAMNFARTAYERGTADRRPMLRETYLHALRAFNAYIGAQVAPGAADSEPVNYTSISSDQQYHALLSACALE